MGPLSQVSGFTFVVNASTAMVCTGSPFFTNVSLAALQYSPFTKTFPPLASIGQSTFHRFSRHRFFADLNLQTLRAEPFAYDKREKHLNLVRSPPGTKGSITWPLKPHK
jgi:hypothetical protein